MKKAGLARLFPSLLPQSEAFADQEALHHHAGVAAVRPDVDERADDAYAIEIMLHAEGRMMDDNPREETSGR
jgi:hypothetical protein